MEWTLSRLAQNLDLTLKGPDAPISGINTLEAAGPGEISFLSNPKYISQLGSTRACAVIVSEEFAAGLERALISKNPYLDFARAVQLFARPQGGFSGRSGQAGIHPEAEVHPSATVYPFVFIGPRARVAQDCQLFPGVYVGEDCEIGKGCILYPNAVLMAGTRLGEGCILHAGCVLGADGFGFARAEGGIRKIPQIGSVRIADDVEIGANSTIDRGALGPTSVGRSTKIDNLVQIGHNVSVGEQSLLVALTGIAGSAKIGDRVTLAGQAGVAGHLKIGNDVTLGPKSGVAKDVPDNFTGGGAPVVDGSTYLRTLSVMPKLPEMHKRLVQLERQVRELKALINQTPNS